MAHNLNFNEERGTYSIFTTKSTWHKLETKVHDAKSSQDAIILANLDYEVEKVPIFADTKDGIGKIINGKFATVRTDNNTPLGVVGDRYKIFQNREAFSFVDSLVQNNAAKFYSAGALGNGESIFLTAKLNEPTVIGNEVIDNYFCLTNSHDGTRGISMCFSQILMVCENTVKEAFRTGNKKQNVRHTESMQLKLTDSAIDMGLFRYKLEQQKEMFKRMINTPVVDVVVKQLITDILNKKEDIIEEDYSTKFKNIVDNVYEYTMNDPAQQNIERRNTLFGVWNGITGYYNHKHNHKNSDNKFNSIMFGSTYEISKKALDICLDQLN